MKINVSGSGHILSQVQSPAHIFLFKPKPNTTTPTPDTPTTTPTTPTTPSTPSTPSATQEDDHIVKFTEQHKEDLRRLPNREYVIMNEKETLMTLVEIVFSFCYDYRITTGEGNVESAWTTSKISPSLSWLETPTSLKESLAFCLRRVLIFPLYRNWNLAMKVFEDTKTVFFLGKRCLLRCLLEMRHIFMKCEFKRHLNKLFLDDYCIWLQRASQQKLKSVFVELEKIQIRKEDIGFPLKDLEEMALEEKDSILMDDQ
eukprot:TRINITY_DN5616_c0_g2_i2.p1 TRINITY_DN5616_c0_g2~~TRINITY_DN5616_c0_g2_i2.p1  ORF type:complete len:290 (+),score=133.17 TRINITY_DN5616_c0_g2_i2:99-872(+)